jgi:putative membrane protein
MKKFISVSASLSIIALVSFVFGTMVLKDDKFLMEAAQGGMAEVELSRIALQKTENEEIRRFAQMMIDEHTAANAELEQIAASKNMAMPTEMSKKHRDAMEKLNGLSGAEFDRAYMKQMVKDHQATVKLFEKQADRGTDADLKAFAAKTLPNLREHLRMARSMSGNMNNTNRNNNSSEYER